MYISCDMCILFSCILCFFFFKQKTAYEMRISDWSSDVCSSDLWGYGQIWSPLLALGTAALVLLLCLGPRDLTEDVHDLLAAREAGDIARVQQIARNLQRGPQPDASHRSLMGTLFIQSHEKLLDRTSVV